MLLEIQENLFWLMKLSPNFKTMLAFPERYNSALIDQFESHKERYRKYPQVLLFDFTRNEDLILMVFFKNRVFLYK